MTDNQLGRTTEQNFKAFFHQKFLSPPRRPDIYRTAWSSIRALHRLNKPLFCILHSAFISVAESCKSTSLPHQLSGSESRLLSAVQLLCLYLHTVYNIPFPIPNPDIRFTTRRSASYPSQHIVYC